MSGILLVEDDDFLRATTKTVLEIAGYQVFAYADGKYALEAFPSILPDLVVSDINMPLLNGYGLLARIRELPAGEIVPFIFLSARSGRADVSSARELGADDYLFKPFEPDELLTAVRARLDRRRIAALFDTRDAHLQTIALLANIIEARDSYTRGHVERVQSYAIRLGQAMEWPLDDMVILEYGALLHDIGKIAIPEAVLNKPGPLTQEEFSIIQTHTTMGARIIEGIAHLRDALPYILYHHEKWDGSGYPEGLRGDLIPRQGRLLALADVFDALTSPRPYHEKVGSNEALQLIGRESGSHFDPQMTDAFIRGQPKGPKL